METMRPQTRAGERRAGGWLLAALLLAGCAAAAPTPTPAPPPVKLLATVFISPTPDADQRRATLMAAPPTLAPVASPSPTATAYVGVFLGEVEADDAGPAMLPNPFDSAALPDLAATRMPACAIPPDPVFGVNWNAEARVTAALGCPIQIAAQFRGVTQVFERGVMYWRGDTDEVWAIAISGPSAGRYWYVQAPGQTDNADTLAPPGLRVPVRGFGAVWRGVPQVRDALGFARTDEQDLGMQSQRYELGLLLLDALAGQVFALVVDGTAYGPYPY